MLTAEQIVAAHKAQLTALHELTKKALVTVEKIAELNVQSSKAALEEHAEQAHALLSVKDIKELTKLQQNALQPLAEKAASYNRHLFEIASGLGNEFSQLAESQMADAQKQFVAAVESAMKNLPNGSELAQAAMQGALTQATSAMDSVHQAFKQSTEAAQTNFAAMADGSIKAAAKATKGRKAV
jgi:phasin family protein